MENRDRETGTRISLNAEEIRGHLNMALGDERLPTGTLMAHALQDLFQAEVRQQGSQVAERAWRALEPSAIEQVAREFQRLIWVEGGPDYHLPAGTFCAAYMTGCAIIGTEWLGLDVDRPGLHHLDDLPSRPGGTNLRRLMHQIDRLTQGLPCRALGMPELVDSFGGQYPDHHLRFPPFALADGVVLLRGMDLMSYGECFCSFSDDMVAELAGSVVRDMQSLWSDPRSFAPPVRAARSAALSVAAALPDVEVIGVTLDISRSTVSIEFDAWDRAYRRGVVVEEFGKIHERGMEVRSPQLERSSKVRALHALGADGRIGALARSVISAAPQGAAAVLGDMAVGYEAFVTLQAGAGPLLLRLYWWDGEIRVASRGEQDLIVSTRQIRFPDTTLPESIADGLEGRPLHALFDHPFHCDAPITAADNDGGSLVVTIAQDIWLVNCREGRMWPEV